VPLGWVEPRWGSAGWNNVGLSSAELGGEAPGRVDRQRWAESTVNGVSISAVGPEANLSSSACLQYTVVAAAVQPLTSDGTESPSSVAFPGSSPRASFPNPPHGLR
jgi:hypothetical protein